MKQDIIRGFAASFPPPQSCKAQPIYDNFKIDNNDLKTIEQIRKDPNDGLNQYEKNRLTKLQSKLQDNEYFYIEKSGRWPGEYVARSEEYLWWISGFSGSAGSCIISKNKAILFTDGRYTIQAAKQSAHFEQVCIIQQTPLNWLKENTNDNDHLLFNAHTLTAAMFQKIQELPIQTQPLNDFLLVDSLWHNRLPEPLGPIWHHSSEYAGVSAADKIAAYQKSLAEKSCDGYIITQPENIAWLLNIRGCDIEHTPIPLSFAIVWQNDKVDWYVDERRLTAEVKKDLAPSIRFHLPQHIYEADFSNKKMGYNKTTTSVALLSLLGENATAFADPSLLPKAQKNTTEQEGMKQAHLIDGAAMIRFLTWLQKEVPQAHVSEVSAAQKLNNLRLEHELCTSISFETISASGPNAALPHYHVNQQSNRMLQVDEIYLIDSGGQYMMGTTDITRTIKLGKATAEEKQAFSLVLKGFIQLFLASFSKETTGDKLDAIARKPLNDNNMDFAHGTGHGVGCYLGVHEGPQSISSRGMNTLMHANMVCSIEPGYYKEGHFGIRTENLAIVKPTFGKNSFCNITYCPIDTGLIELSLLTQVERDWLNHYHSKVREKLSPLLFGDKEAKEYLYQATKVI
ncbi:MAG: M24 family metallopeptidase [Alphaproteobacteria bacterium]